MKLAVSNLAFSPADDANILTKLKVLGVEGIEVAPTRIGNWGSLTERTVGQYGNAVHGAGLQIPSLQALLFGTSGLQLLQDTASFDALGEHLRRVSAIGAQLGAGIGVFGSPNNRRRGRLDVADAFELGRDRLGALAAIVHAEGFSLGLEPIPSCYGCDFLETATETLAMITAVHHPGLKVHLDTACIALGGESISGAIRSAGGSIAHVQIAEPDLGPFDIPILEHSAAASALREVYDGWISIEMREQTSAPLEAVCTAVRFVQTTYLPVSKAD